MIDDRQTCDVCGEEFNEDRPHAEHAKKVLEKSMTIDTPPGLTVTETPEDIQSE